MANIKSSKIIRFYWTRRPYGHGADRSGAYMDYFLEDVVDDIFKQQKVKQFCEHWNRKAKKAKTPGIQQLLF